jgi:hypothetical protein
MATDKNPKLNANSDTSQNSSTEIGADSLGELSATRKKRTAKKTSSTPKRVSIKKAPTMEKMGLRELILPRHLDLTI